MPDPVPAMVLGRLAIHRDYQGAGMGTGLLRDTVLRTTQAADVTGTRG
jgi:predicted N-acetyltransferase YhbS